MNSYGIRGKDTALMHAVEKAVKVAPFDVPVLITGENGTGKEVFHRILHEQSRRRHGKRLAINCGGLPEDTITSELFGHVKGAYTGSVGDRKGYFEEADGGTLFLDEVGELPMSVQAKLLRVLENGEIIRMGSNDVKRVDVRIVAATNVDLAKAIAEGKFRQDLYFRLSTIFIQVPPLRDRGEDIITLFRYFSAEMAKKFQMTQRLELTEESRIRLRGYSWPGNVRQMQNLVKEMSIMEADNRLVTAEVLDKYLPHSGAIASGKDNTVSAQELEMIKAAIYSLKIDLDMVRERLGMKSPKRPVHALPPASQQSMYPTSSQNNEILNETKFDAAELVEVEEVSFSNPQSTSQEPNVEPKSDTAGKPLTKSEIEKEFIREALRRNGGNKRKTAAELDVSERTIHRKIQNYGLDKEGW